MSKIIAAFVTLIAWITQSRADTKALQKQVEDRDAIIATQNDTITDLHAQLDALDLKDKADVQALEDSKAAQEDSLAAQKKAEDELAAVNASIAEAQAKADETIAAISADPAIPVVVAPDGTATADVPPASGQSPTGGNEPPK